MKTKITIILLLIGFRLSAQTITYANFSTALTSTLNAMLANNASFNASLPLITGTGVTWDASGLTQQAATPSLHIIFADPSTTPYASLYTNSNYAQYDPALTSIMEYGYYMYDADSISKTGAYNSNTDQHEIYQNADKSMIFPFSFGQSFSDTYEKTNYSDATTVSSYQTGIRNVNYNGFGTLILPQASFTNVALITEVRTNSLGPDSYTYTWYDVSNGKQLLYYHENAGTATVAYSPDLSTGSNEINSTASTVIYPNPFSGSAMLHISGTYQIKNAELTITNAIGQTVKSMIVNNNEVEVNSNELIEGIYFYTLIMNNKSISNGKLMVY